MMLTSNIIKNPYLTDEEKFKELERKEYYYNHDKSYRYLQLKLDIAENYCNECKLNQSEKEEVKNIIKSIKNLKTLCHNCNLEQIISIIVLRTKRIRRPKSRINITKYRLWRINKINWRRYSLITERIGDYYMKKYI